MRNYILIIVLGIILSVGYFAVTTFKSMAEQNESLKNKIVSLEAERAELVQLSNGMAKNEKETAKILDNKERTIKEIQDVEKTTKCIDSPALGIALGSLRQR